MLQSFTKCQRVLKSVTEYYRVLQSITEYNTVSQSITEYYKVKSSASTWTNFWACFFFKKRPPFQRSVASQAVIQEAVNTVNTFVFFHPVLVKKGCFFVYANVNRLTMFTQVLGVLR